MHDLANQARANVNANTNFKKGWIKIKDVARLICIRIATDYEYQQISFYFCLNLLHLSSAQKLECTFTTQVTVV